jgi:hypothetical protein
MFEEYAACFADCVEVEQEGDYLIARIVYDDQYTMISCARDLLRVGAREVGLVNIDDPDGELGDEHWMVELKLYLPGYGTNIAAAANSIMLRWGR